MFNSPRPKPQTNLSTSAFLTTTTTTTGPSSTSAFSSDPLANSMPNPNFGSSTAGGGDLDPWSSAPSPARSGTPRRESDAVLPVRGGGAVHGSDRDGMHGLLNDPPALYLSLLDQLEPSPTGELPLSTVHRLLATSKLPASTIERASPPTAHSFAVPSSLTPNHPAPLSTHSTLFSTSSLFELFGHESLFDVMQILSLTSPSRSSLTRSDFFLTLALVALAQSDPTSSANSLTLETLTSTLPDIPLPRLSIPPSTVSQVSQVSRSPPPSYAANTSTLGASPWDTAPRINGSGQGHGDGGVSGFMEGAGAGGGSNGVEVGPERGWWKDLEKVEVGLIAEKEGWFLQKYRVTSSPDCIMRAGKGAEMVEEGLVIAKEKRDSEPVSRRYSDFVWLLDCLVKRYPFRLLPSLPPKRIGPDASFLEQRRRALQRFLQVLVTHPVTTTDGALHVFLTSSTFESWRKRTQVSTDEESLSKRLNPAQEMSIPLDLDTKLSNLRERLPGLLGSYQKLVGLAERSLARCQSGSGDDSRFALGLRTLEEEMPKGCWRCVSGGSGAEPAGGAGGAGGTGAGVGEGCDLCRGVGRGLGEVAEGWTRLAEEGERRVQILQTHIEALKTQRDLYLSFRDLFVRHDKLSKDSVDALRKKVEGRLKKADGLRAAGKVGWEGEVDKLIAANDQDTSQITNLLARRVFIRACMWHELSVVFHSRQAAQATLGWKAFVQAERDAAQGVVSVWEGVGERVAGMPVD